MLISNPANPRPAVRQMLAASWYEYLALSRGQPAGAGQNLCSLAWRCRARPRHRRWCERRAVARAPCPKAPCSSGSGGRCEGGIGGAAPSRPGAADPRPGLSRGGGPHPPPPGAPGGEERRHSGGPGSAEPRLTHRGDGSLLPPHHPQREGRSARHAQVSRRPSPSAPHLGLHAGYRGRPPHTAALRRAARNLRASSVGAETLCCPCRPSLRCRGAGERGCARRACDATV